METLKKILLTSTILLCCIVSMNAQVTIDGCIYFIRENYAVCEGNKYYWGRENVNFEIVIPEKIKVGGREYPVKVIETYAFKGNTGLTSVTIPNSVTSIGDEAFRECSGLTSVTIGNSVTSIGSSAFKGCTDLTEIKVESGNSKYDSRDNCNAIVETESNTLILACNNSTIPNSVTSIGNSAFSGCSGLASVDIPNSVTSIGSSAFRGCSGLTSVTIGNSVTSIGNYAFSGCSGLTSVTIPNSVTSIGTSAFSGCSGLTSVTIPNSVTSIGNSAFSGCSGLTSVTIPASVTSIGNYAFSDCTGELLLNCNIQSNAFSYSKFTSVIIGDSVTSIGWSAFRDCTGLTSVTIPNSVTSIEESAFYGCSGLTSITIPNSVTSIGESAFEGCTGLTSVTIPNSVTSIGSSAFSGCTGLTSVTIGSSVTSIGSSAFYGCTGLTSMTIGNSVQSIGGSAFSGCTGLTSVTIPNSVTSIGRAAFRETGWYNNQADGVLYLDEWLIGYKGNEPKGAVEIKEGIKRIANYAFYYCDSLTSVTIPNTVTSIGDCAFYNCTGLKSLDIPSSVTSIGTDALYGTGWLNSQPSGEVYIGNCLMGYNGTMKANTSIVIKNGTKVIGANAFKGCSGLTSVTIPNSVTTIEKGAFYGCYNLTSLTIPNSVTSIGYQAFYGCSDLKNLHIEDGDKELSLGYNGWSYNNPGLGLFYDCRLDSIYIGRDLSYSSSKNGGYSPFANNKRLFKVIIGNSVTSIGEGMFYGCTNVKEVYIKKGNKVLSLGRNEYKEGLFYDCPLETLYIGRNLKYNTDTDYGYSPFYYQAKLNTLTISNSVTSISGSIFSSHPGLTEIKVESGNSKYDSRDNCNAIVETESNTLILGCVNSTIPNSVTSIESSAFRGCTGLTSVAIPNSVTSIGSSAFRGCSGLTSVTIGNSVTSIGDGAFDDCSGLTSVHITDLSAWCKIKFDYSLSNPTYYAHHLYLNGEEITDLNIPKGIECINDYAFYNCSGLTSVTIPNSVTGIGSSAFSDCSGLTSVHITDLSAWCKIKFDYSRSNPTYYAHHLYLNGEEITDLNIPKGIECINDYAFYNCSGLTSVTIPNSVTSIGWSAFYGCTGLTALTIPNSVINLEYGAFDNCTGITTLIYNAPTFEIRNFSMPSLTNLIIGDSVTYIVHGYSNLENLKSIKVEERNKFYDSRDNCNAIIETETNELIFGCQNTIIPNSVNGVATNALRYTNWYDNQSDGIVYFSNWLIDYKGDMPENTSVTIKEGTKGIADSAFEMCTGLISVTIPNSVTSIGKAAFAGCSGLTSINIPNSVTSIGIGALTNESDMPLKIHISDISSFAKIKKELMWSVAYQLYYNNKEITNLVIPDGTEYISQFAFHGVIGIETVIIPNSVKYIGDYAFNTLQPLRTVTKNTIKPSSINFSVFNLEEPSTLYVPYGGKTNYLASAGWNNFSNIVEMPGALFSVSDIMVYPNQSFALPISMENNCELTSFQCDIYIPEGVTLQKNSKGKYDITLDSERCDDHTLTIAEQPDGAIRVVAVSMTSSLFSGTEGPLLNLNLLAGEELGNYTIEVKNIKASDASSKLYTLDDCAGTIEVYYKPGDANGDGQVAVNDVVCTVNYILNIVSEDFKFQAADMTGDGEIYVNDVVSIVNTILGTSTTTAALAPRHMNAYETLSVADSRTACGMTEFGITLSNASRYTAMQFEMELAEGADIADIKMSMSTDHSVAYRRIDDTTVRVVVTSLTNEALAEGAQLCISMKDAAGKTVAFTNGRAACNNGQMVGIMPGSTVLGGTTGIDGINAEFAPADVYSIDGRIVKKNATTIDGLKPGLYVVNGRKVVVER